MPKQEFQLRAHAITARDDDRIAIRREIVTGGEQTERLMELAVPFRPGSEFADVPHQGGRLTDVDTGLFVSELAVAHAEAARRW